MKTGDVIGHKFGRWTAIGPCSDRIRVWCKCDCGTIRPVIPYNLVYGKSHSCGCEKKKKKEEKKEKTTMQDVFLDMTKFGGISGVKYPDCECCKHILLEDMLGIRFGNLVVIGDGEKPFYVKCRCDCGNTIDVAKYNLLYGKKQSCGCIPEPVVRRESHTIPAPGTRYGKLTLLEYLPPVDKKVGARAKCRCDCGNVVTVRFSNLYCNVTTSCGCLVNKSGRKNIFFANGAQMWVATFWDSEQKKQIRVARGKERYIVEQKYDAFLASRGLSA